MTEEEIKAKEAADAEAAAKAAAEAEAASSSTQEDKIDYKVIAEANEALAVAEKARADAAEALIIRNKEIAKRQKENNGGENTGLTEERVIELIKTATTKEDESPEAKALEEANKKLAETKAKLAEVARAQKATEQKRSDSATTHFDGSKVTAPKIAENSPLKDFKYEGNGIYSQKLSSGKTMFKNTNAAPGQPKTWIA